MNAIAQSRILVVDDAATVRMFHRLILEESGYQVDEAYNGVEALEKTLRQRYDLYLVDVNMPRLDGYSFLRELRRLEIEQSPAVMISTEESAIDRTQAFVAGANFYLTKPTKPPVLLGVVQLLLGHMGAQA